MTTRKPLTLPAIRYMQPGATLWDHVVTGLHVRRRSEATTFGLYYKAHSGARRVLKLGNWPQLTLELARDAARDLLRQVATGADPAQRKQDARAAPTVADLAAEWLRRKVPPVKKPRSYKEDQYNLSNHVLPRFGQAKVADVTSQDVATAIAAIERQSGPTAARNVRTLLSGLFTLAAHSELGWRERNRNPVVDVPRPKSGKRKVHIAADQFGALAAEFENLRRGWPEHIACIWVALYCGTRITELATAKASQLHGSQLILSDHKTDATGNERVIRLPALARAELDRLPIHPNGYLFGALGAMNEGNKDGARRSVHYVFDLARTAAGCPEIRPQDLRRTFASVAKSRGVSLSQIGELFGHGSTQTTLRYAWLFDDAAQQTADDVSEAIRQLATARQSGESDGA